MIDTYVDTRYLEEVKDRDRIGILTERDVEVLLKDGEDYMNHTDVRYRIRERVQSAIRDLAFLFFRMPNRDRRKVIQNLNSKHPDEYDTTIVDAPAFLFICTFGAERYLEDTPVDPAPGFDLEARLEAFASRVVYRSEILKGNLPEIEIQAEIDSEAADAEEVRETILKGNGEWRHFNYLVSTNELAPLLESIIERGTPVDLSDENSAIESFFGPKRAERWLNALETMDKKWGRQVE